MEREDEDKCVFMFYVLLLFYWYLEAKSVGDCVPKSSSTWRTQVEPCLAVFSGVPSWSQGADELVAWHAEQARRRGILGIILPYPSLLCLCAFDMSGQNA